MGGSRKAARPPKQVGGDHYERLDPQPITVIEQWGLDHHLACALKYIARRRSRTDIEKAAWYLQRYLEVTGG